MSTKNTSRVAIVVAIVLVVVAAIAVWIVIRTKSLQACGDSCRIKPMCSNKTEEHCNASFNTLQQLDQQLRGCGEDYTKQYGGKVPVYYLKEHPTKTFSYMKRSIHIVIHKPDGVTRYDNDTLMYVGLHELAHVLCNKLDGDAHGPEFQLVFGRLLNIAVAKNIYNPEAQIDREYPSV